jgi:sulfopyruvate decarboxylase TPP-binding subunit
VTEHAHIGEEMTAFVKEVDVASELCKELIAADFGPFFGTPCRSLTPLHAALHGQVGILTVAREENAIGIASGTSLAGRCPVVLMENPGIAQSVNAIASLVVPYRIPMLLIVGLVEESAPDTTLLGRLTQQLLEGLGIEAAGLDPTEPLGTQVEQVNNIVQRRLQPAALLVPPAAFGRRA